MAPQKPVIGCGSEEIEAADRRDEVLRRMLSTPPKKHEDKKASKGKEDAMRVTEANRKPSTR